MWSSFPCSRYICRKINSIVKRDVIRVVTPGTVIESNLLDEKKNNYIMSVFKNGICFGIAICDVSTGDFYATEINEQNNFERLLDEISRFTPAEIITNELLYNTKEEIDKINERFNVFVTQVAEEAFLQDAENIKNNYELVTDKGKIAENVDKKLLAVSAINALLYYLNQTQKMKLKHINKIQIYNTNKYMSLDINARRNLELTEKMRDKSKKGTLLWVLDKTNTSMGGRNLRRWLSDPLIDAEEINERLDAVEELKDNVVLKGDVIE